MKINYEKEMNKVIDPHKKKECINLSIGAETRKDFAWIANNLDLFIQKSIESYNKIISEIRYQTHVKLYFIIHEKKDIEFSAVEKHLGIWHRFANIELAHKSKDFYVNDNLRCAFAELDSLNITQLSILHCGDLVFLKDEVEIKHCLDNLTKHKSIFDSFFNKGYLLATFKNLWTDGNALSFFSKNTQSLSEIMRIAQYEDFLIRQN